MIQDGALVKLTITPFEDAEGAQASQPAGDAFVAQFNPESYSIKNDVKLNSEQSAQGANGAEAKQVKVEPKEFNFEFLLDGTGATGEKLDVTKTIDHFKTTTGFSGETHRNRFLLLQWGQFKTECVLKSFSINYKLFKADGTPLRAMISATFQEHIALEKQAKQDNRSSPDLTYLREIKAGDELSYLCYQKYKDSRYYYQVASHNKLNNLRSLAGGKELLFPPLKEQP